VKSEEFATASIMARLQILHFSLLLFYDIFWAFSFLFSIFAGNNKITTNEAHLIICMPADGCHPTGTD
jgi:hypothetical protein